MPSPWELAMNDGMGPARLSKSLTVSVTLEDFRFLRAYCARYKVKQSVVLRNIILSQLQPLKTLHPELLEQ